MVPRLRFGLVFGQIGLVDIDRPARNRFPAGLLFQPGRRPPKTGSRAEESYTTFLLALRRFLLVRRRLSRVRFTRGECRYVSNALLIAGSDIESSGIGLLLAVVHPSDSNVIVIGTAGIE